MSSLYNTMQKLTGRGNSFTGGGNSAAFYKTIEEVLNQNKQNFKSGEKTEVILGHAKEYAKGELKQTFSLDFAQKTSGGDPSLVGSEKEDIFTRTKRKQFVDKTEDFAYKYLGNMVSVIVGRRLVNNKTKVEFSYASAKIKVSKYAGLRRKNGQFIDAGSLVAIMNSYLPVYVANEMGMPATGGREKTFTYRSGQFASSVQTQQLTTDGPQGSIFMRIVYQSNPYGVFGHVADNGADYTKYARAETVILRAARHFLIDTLHLSSVRRFLSGNSKMIAEGLTGEKTMSYSNEVL